MICRCALNTRHRTSRAEYNVVITLRLQPLAGQGRRLVSARFQFQVTHQAHRTVVVQRLVDLRDGGENIDQITFDIRAGGVRLDNEVVPLQQPDNAVLTETPVPIGTTWNSAVACMAGTHK